MIKNEKKVDLTPTGQSYFDSQRSEYNRIIENGRRFMKKRDEEDCVKKLFDKNGMATSHHITGFKKGIEFAEKWILVEEELPEDNEYFLEMREDEFDPETTIKVLAMTDTGDITDNRRVKMQVGEKKWTWLMGYEGSEVVKWRPLNVL